MRLKKKIIIFSCAVLSIGCLIGVYYAHDDTKSSIISKNDINKSAKEIENINERDNVVDADIFEDSISNMQTNDQGSTSTTEIHKDLNKTKDKQKEKNKNQKVEIEQDQEKEEQSLTEEIKKPENNQPGSSKPENTKPGNNQPENNQPEDNSESELELPKVEEPGWLLGIY